MVIKLIKHVDIAALTETKRKGNGIEEEKSTSRYIVVQVKTNEADVGFRS